MKPRTIVPNQTFKHAAKTYEEGESYEVSIEDAEYFEAAGWIGERAETSKAQTLDIHDVMLGHSAEVN